MLLKVRSFVPLIRKLALLFLAFTVFSFGLQAKLSLYRPISTPNTSAAKISTERYSAQVLNALERPDGVSSCRYEFDLVFLVNNIAPSLDAVAQRAEIVLWHPGRFDLHGVFSLHRPPPFLS
jgi:hypothetical protein